MSSSNITFHPFVVCGRIVRHALHGIARNIGISIITITIMVLALVSVNALLAVRALTTAAVAAIGEQVDLTFYFTRSATQEQIDGVKLYVTKFPEVASLELVDRARALELFRARHASNPAVLKSLELLPDNPFGAYLVVRARDTGKYDRIVRSIEAQPWQSFIQRRSFADRARVIERINGVTARTQQFSLWLSALFIGIAVLIIFNAVRMAIYTQREEISIKKLVGATNGFIRAPFFIEGTLYVLLAFTVVIALVYSAARYIDPLLGTLFVHNGFTLQRYFFSPWYTLLTGELCAALVITWMTAAFAMRRYLRT